MRVKPFLPAALAAGCLLVFAGCRGCGCSRGAPDSGTPRADAGTQAKSQPPAAEKAAAEQPDQPAKEPAATTKPGTGMIEMKPGAVLTTSGKAAAAAQVPAGELQVPPSTIRAIMALKEFQRTHPRLVIRSDKKSEPSGAPRENLELRKKPIGALPLKGKLKAPGK